MGADYKRFKENWKASKERQLIRGAYHYYRPNENSIEQANNFIKNVKLEKGDLPPVLDIEKLPKSQSIDSLKVGLRRWLKKVEKHYKVKPIIYSGESYYNDFLKKEFSDYPLWIANYNFWRNHLEDDWIYFQSSVFFKALYFLQNEETDLHIYFYFFFLFFNALPRHYQSRT